LIVVVILQKPHKLTFGNSKLLNYNLLGARVALCEALCACALQIIIIPVKLCVFLPAKIKIKKLNIVRNFPWLIYEV
jgi:hypothetical protein